MFASATLKLTAWYMLILIAISLTFSVIIFGLATSEVSNRLERLQIRLEGTQRTITLPGPLTLNDVRVNQTNEARTSIFIGLLYTNLAVIAAGGIGSFLLARRTLRPIEEAHERQSRFTSDASHELRTPLAIMKSEIQVALRDSNASKSELFGLLRSNLEEVDKLSELTTSLLQLSKLEEDTVRRNERINVCLIMKTCLMRFEGSNRTFDLLSDKSVISVEGNKTLLQDLFSIVIDNAIKYSPAASTIAIRLASNGRTCTITITNTGEGIPSSELNAVFDRFYQIDRAREGTKTGYGLGLSLARRITAIHDGKISLSSTEDQHTTCTIDLPTVRKNR